MSMKPGVAAEIALGLGIAALGAFILFETRLIKVAPIYAKVGPAVIPTIVGIILLILGLVFVWQSWRNRHAPAAMGLDAPGSLLDTPGTATPPTDWKALIAISIGLVLQVLLLDPEDAPFGLDAALNQPFFQAIGGFIPTAALLFLCVAVAFGSRRYLRDLAIGIVLAVVVYIGFVKALNLPLPPGLTGDLIDGLF
jgi:putative tricarboxylic transport membrane protein